MVGLNQEIIEELDRRAMSSLLDDQTPEMESFGIALSSVDNNGIAQKLTTGKVKFVEPNRRKI